MPSYSCSSSRHLPTRLLQLCPLRSAFIHTTTLILGTTYCCSSARLIKDLSPRDHITPSLKQLHPCPYCIQNLPPHVSYPFWNLSIIHVIHGYAMLCFQLQRTPIIHAWRFCCNSHKSEVWQSTSQMVSVLNSTSFLTLFFSA